VNTVSRNADVNKFNWGLLMCLNIGKINIPNKLVPITSETVQDISISRDSASMELITLQ
jgi:hypothetical protein